MTPAPNVAATRRRLESAVERAIELLNTLDGDCDLEPDDDSEPEFDLGAPEDEGSTAMHGFKGSGAGCCVFDGF